MDSIKQIQTVKSGSITINLPPEFDTKKVEITVSTIDNENSEVDELQKILLSSPTLTEEEIGEFDKTKKWMNQWNVNEF